jgi:outer membrane protein assembly factor BamB
MMSPEKIFNPLFILLAILFVPHAVMGQEYLSLPEWEVPAFHSYHAANQNPLIHVADNGRLISMNFPYEPDFFVYDGNGTVLFNKTLSAEKPSWISSISPTSDGSGLAVTQLVPGCCHGSVSNTTSNKVMFLDRSGRTVWEYVTHEPSLASAVVPDTGNIVIGTDEGRILCLDRNGSVRWTTVVEAPVVSLTVAADGKTIVAAGDSNYDAWKHYGEQLNPFDLFFLDAGGNVLGKYQTRGKNTVSASRNASQIAVIGGPFGNLMLFNRTGTKTGERSFPGTVSTHSINGDGTRIIVITSHGQVYYLDEKLRETGNIPAEPGSMGFAVSGTGDRIARGNNRTVTLSWISGGVPDTYTTDSRVRVIVPVPGTESFVIATEERLVFLNGTAPGTLTEIPQDHPATTGQQATAAPLPLIIVITAPGIAFLVLLYGKKIR